MLRVKLRLRKRLAETAFLRQLRLSLSPCGRCGFLTKHIAFSGSYGYFNMANISAGISDTLSYSVPVYRLVYNTDYVSNSKSQKMQLRPSFYVVSTAVRL